jgi:hypothetical protein
MQSNCDGDRSVHQRQSKKVFNLKDIDLKRVTVEVIGFEGLMFDAQVVRLETLNSRPSIVHSDRFEGSDAFVRRTVIDGNNRSAIIVVHTVDDAKRVANAFEHAIGLCGGKPSPF